MVEFSLAALRNLLPQMRGANFGTTSALEDADMPLSELDRAARYALPFSAQPRSQYDETVKYQTVNPLVQITEGDIGRATEAAMGVSGGGMSTKFRAYRAHNPGESQSGHAYYALDENTAKAYLDPKGVVREHSIELNNPLILDTPGKIQSAWDTSGALKVPGDFYPHQQSALNDWARKQGYDGLVVPHSAFEGEAGYKIAGGTFGEPQIVKFQPPGIRAFHSSPHDFDKFDLAKIGTGEGAQVYGHGLYFAENPAVSGQGGQYWKAFSERFKEGPESKAVQYLKTEGMDRAAAARAIEEEIEATRQSIARGENYLSADSNAKYLRDMDHARALLQSDKPVGPRTYEVNINADPAHMLDWDKALSAQGNVREALSRVNVPGVPLVQRLESGRLQPTGNEIYRTLEQSLPGVNTRASASAALREAGIPGIKYLDQGSRGVAKQSDELLKIYGTPERVREVAQQAVARGEDADYWQSILRGLGGRSHNYVIFDPNLIRIDKKYAVPGAIGAGGLMSLQALQDQQQPRM